MIICEICGRGPAPEHGGVSVVRQNTKGVTGIWRCLAHNEVVMDAGVKRIVDVLEGVDVDEDL